MAENKLWLYFALHRLLQDDNVMVKWINFFEAQFLVYWDFFVCFCDSPSLWKAASKMAHHGTHFLVFTPLSESREQVWVWAQFATLLFFAFVQNNTVYTVLCYKCFSFKNHTLLCSYGHHVLLKPRATKSGAHAACMAQPIYRHRSRVIE